MGTAYLYVTSETEEQDANIDFNPLIEWLERMEIAQRYESSPSWHHGWGVFMAGNGPQSVKLFNADYTYPGSKRLGDIADHWRRAFDSLELVTAPFGMPLPLTTHVYPAFCPGCSEPIDQAFQDSIQSGDLTEHAIDKDHHFPCPKCRRAVTYQELVDRENLLHRRHYVVVDDSCYRASDVMMLSEASREILCETFGGPIAVRHGWIS